MKATASARSALVLDFNGVLVNDEELHRQCFNVVLEPLGIALDAPLYYERYLGFDDRGAFEAVLLDHGRPVTAVTVAGLIERKALHYQQRAERELEFFPGVAELLASQAARREVVVVSGALRPEIELALGLLRARHFVQHVVAAEDVSKCKPSPEGYLQALSWLRVRGPLDARRVLVLEDSSAGLTAARDAGLRALAVAHTLPRAELWAAGAERVWDRLADVRHFQLDELLQR